jgi:predicted O-methyltransferase YrrM
MNPILAEILATNQVLTANGETLPLHSHLPEIEGAILQGWLHELNPQRVLEIGMAYGISSLYICDALAEVEGLECRIIDPHQHSEWHSVGVANLERAGFGERYRLYAEPSELCLPRLLAEGIALDFAYVDGWHSFDHALVDFFYINRMLRVGGVVVFDDAQLPSITKLAAYIRSYPAYADLPIAESLRTHRGLRVRRMLRAPASRLVAFRKVAADERSWDWFCEF